MVGRMERSISERRESNGTRGLFGIFPRMGSPYAAKKGTR